MNSKGATDVSVFAYALILVGLTLSGSLSGVLSDIAYPLAFILPSVLPLVVGKRAGASLPKLKIKREKLPIFLLSVFPSVVAILAVSLLTSFVLGLFGRVSEVTVYETLCENMLRHAIFPAFLEETAFRLMPMSLFGKSGRRECIIVSSVCFAAVHASLFQIPYAFVAGVIFITLNYACESALPSFVIHVINNGMSVISLYYELDISVIIAVSLLAILSLILIYRKKIPCLELLRDVFCEKCKLKLSFSLLIIVIPTLIVAIISLL